MALSIVSSPNKVNATTNNLPIVVTSPSMSMAQYRLVTEIYIPQRGTSPITTIKTFPSASVAMIDIARVCSTYLTYDNAMEATGSEYSNTNAAYFRVVMGEEYADSPSGSIISYNGLGQTGSAAFSASFGPSPIKEELLLVPAVNEYSNLTYNWPESEWNESSGNPFLTNNPAYQESSFWTNGNWDNLTGELFSYDYATISSVTDAFDNGFAFVNARLYDAAGTLVYENDTSFDDSQSPLGPLTHFGIGPANLSSSNFPNSLPAFSASRYISDDNWSRITYEFEGFNNNFNIGFTQASCSFYDQELNNLDKQSSLIKGRTRFAFINKYGVMDYYNVINPISRTSRISRKNYVKPQLPWSTLNTSSGAVFNVSKRGKDDYYTTYKDNYKVTTDYMNTATSDWLTELIESPSVFIQNEAIVNLNADNGVYFNSRKTAPNGFAPINIKNASYTWKTNKFSQKLFQYDLLWEMSNINIGR